METSRFQREAETFAKRIESYEGYIRIYDELSGAYGRIVKDLSGIQNPTEEQIIKRCESELKMIEADASKRNAESIKADYENSYKRLLDAHEKYTQKINDGKYELLLTEYKDNLTKATKAKVNGLEHFRKVMADAAMAKSLDEKISAYQPLEAANKNILTLIP